MIIKPTNPYDPNSEWLVPIIGCQYRADKQDGHWLDDAIYWWSKRFTREVKEPHSHSELLYLLWTPSVRHPRDYGIEGMSLVFSADTRRGDGFVGTRFEEARIVLRNPDRWDFYFKLVREKEAYAMFERSLEIEGKKYAYIAILPHYFLPFGILGNWLCDLFNVWYCSPTVSFTINDWREKDGEPKNIRISPIRLTRWYNQNKWRKLTDGQKTAICRYWAEMGD